MHCALTYRIRHVRLYVHGHKLCASIGVQTHAVALCGAGQVLFPYCDGMYEAIVFTCIEAFTKQMQQNLIERGKHLSLRKRARQTLPLHFVDGWQLICCWLL